MLQLLRLTFSLLPWIPVFLCKVVTEGEFAVLEGGSLIIPCHYEPQYADHVKYWCHGHTKEFCTSLARTDDPQVINPTEERVSIFDDPVQQVFTVTMNKLKEGDSGWYMCGVEIGGMWTADDTTVTNIKVIHGMFAVNSVSGEEGSSVTVQCLYSERYRESEKKWCRRGDPRLCRSTGSAGSFDDSSVAIRDDRTWAFTVTFKKLQTTDTALYLCSAGQKMIAVRVLVTPRPTTMVPPVTPRLTRSQSVVHLPPNKTITTESWISDSHMLTSMVVCSSVFVIVVVAIVFRRLWKTLNQSSLPAEVDKLNVKFVGVSKERDFPNATVVFLNKNFQNV